MKRILLLATTLALACGLMLGSVGSVLAGENQNEGCRGLFGTVDADKVTIDDNGTGTITLTNVKPLEAAATVEIAVTENTTYHIPTVTVFPSWQTWKQLTHQSRELVQEANRVAMLLAEPLTDPATQQPVALKVMVNPAKKLYRYRHQLGVVVAVAVAGDNATIAKRNGEQITVTIGDGVELKEGQFVVIITDKATGEADVRAVDAYRAERLVERFEGYMEGSLNQEDFDAVTARMQAAYEKHIAVLEETKTRLEEHNRAQAAKMVQKAIDYADARYAEAMQLREQISQRVEACGGWEQWGKQWKEINGTIASVDYAGRTVTINTVNGTGDMVPVTLKSLGRTRIVKDGKLFAFRSLSSGDMVEKAVYHVGATNDAIYIEIG